MSRRRRGLVITWTEDGVQYIRVKDSGIHPLCVACDGLRITLFGKETEAHLRLADALEWHRTELPRTRGKERELTEKAIAKMSAMLARQAPDDMETV